MVTHTYNKEKQNKKKKKNTKKKQKRRKKDKNPRPVRRQIELWPARKNKKLFFFFTVTLSLIDNLFWFS